MDSEPNFLPHPEILSKGWSSSLASCFRVGSCLKTAWFQMSGLICFYCFCFCFSESTWNSHSSSLSLLSTRVLLCATTRSYFVARSFWLVFVFDSGGGLFLFFSNVWNFCYNHSLLRGLAQQPGGPWVTVGLLSLLVLSACFSQLEHGASLRMCKQDSSGLTAWIYILCPIFPAKGLHYNSRMTSVYKFQSCCFLINKAVWLC